MQVQWFSITYNPNDWCHQPWHLMVQYTIGYFVYYEFTANDILRILDEFCRVPMPGWPGRS